ncbi:uncharacterized protein LOC133779860 [Humulus lupulus]|uniref:uncharacterized protein LOC133779860 n=1 Tax=Humulus lupulus TaxID=3486 RepID=UPI002B407C32|nr:uncharacterized protein LOC133779860 [Humulus lupulus]
MVSRNYRPSMEKSSIDLNHETSSTSVSETQPEHSVEGLENVVLHNEDESSGWSDEKILENAHQLYKSENNNSNFLLVDCWRLLNDEPKWNTMYQPKCGKRTKVSDTGAFTSSSNADISDDEVREVRPTGQKAAKRKGKEKKDTHARFIEISERKASALEKLVAIKEKEAEDNRMTKYMDYLIMDTSHMTPEQKKDHENLYYILTAIF